MTTFVLINNTSDLSGEQERPRKLLKKRLSVQKISGIFFYSEAVNQLLNEVRLNEWLEYSLSEGISLYVCRNSLIKKNISGEINPAINVVGLGQLIEGVLNSKKTIVIGDL